MEESQIYPAKIVAKIVSFPIPDDSISYLQTNLGLPGPPLHGSSSTQPLI